MEEHKSNEIIEKLNQEVLEKQEELDRLNKMKGRLFSIVSHDIKSPIGIVTGFSEVLMNHISENYDVKDDPQLDLIKKHLSDGKGRLLTLLEDLIFWVKCENGSMPFKAKVHEAKHLLESAVGLLKTQVRDKEITVAVEVDDSLKLFGDSNTLLVIFKNLLANAIKYSPKNGTVSLSGTKKDRVAVIKISDSGIGIPHGIIDQIYEANKDKIRPGTNGESGIGLGLTVVHGFVDLNKGAISVDSKEGEGTTFTLILPSEEIEQ